MRPELEAVKRKIDSCIEELRPTMVATIGASTIKSLIETYAFAAVEHDVPDVEAYAISGFLVFSCLITHVGKANNRLLHGLSELWGIGLEWGEMKTFLMRNAMTLRAGIAGFEGKRIMFSPTEFYCWDMFCYLLASVNRMPVALHQFWRMVPQPIQDVARDIICHRRVPEVVVEDGGLGEHLLAEQEEQEQNIDVSYVAPSWFSSLPVRTVRFVGRKFNSISFWSSAVHGFSAGTEHFTENVLKREFDGTVAIIWHSLRFSSVIVGALFGVTENFGRNTREKVYLVVLFLLSVFELLNFQVANYDNFGIGAQSTICATFGLMLLLEFSLLALKFCSVRLRSGSNRDVDDQGVVTDIGGDAGYAPPLFKPVEDGSYSGIELEPLDPLDPDDDGESESENSNPTSGV